MYLASILGFLYTNILPFIILLGILIFVHELGHFAVARMCGVRVEVFSLGFGKKIFSFRRGDTTYCISLIPLGGYVKMFGEQGSQEIKTEEDRKVAYSYKNPWQRIAIVAAGPLMNFFFAAFVFALIAQMGEQTKAPVIEDVAAGSIAATAGFQAGDRILKVGSNSIASYEDFQKQLNENQNATVEVVVKNPEGVERAVNVNVASANNPNIFSMSSRIGQIEGLLPYARSAAVAVMTGTPAYELGFRSGDQITAVNGTTVPRWVNLVASFDSAATDLNVTLNRPSAEIDGKVQNTEMSIVVPLKTLKKAKSVQGFGFDNTELYLDMVVKDSPADKAGLQKFDKVISINQVPITKWDDISNTIRSFNGTDAMTFVIQRDGAEMIKKITPQITELNTAFGGIDKRFTVGITPYLVFTEPEMTVVHSASIFHSVAKGFQRTVDVSVMTVMSFVRLFQGEVSVKNVGGMVTIGKVAKDSFEIGAQAFLMTMGILSVSLFILNLLPIPVLDGGHLVFYTIELIKGSPLSLKKIEMAQQVGLVLLLALMILAQFNDIVKFLFKS
ncbi:zinc metalloprotease [Pseudobdellovibrio exovorus JSS]|uniref:Zinc metalloprotease n=2 Tax=Pseudobdellovibrio exovorus TaxID=453816 RepID=M4VMN8_9BACT|nr:zinc metalloprotease [Pseudobdellovibrio exovorus JSS]